MKTAVYYNNKDIRIEERPIPKAGDTDIVMKIYASGICGSDVMEWYRIKKAPVVLGHEIAGIIVDAGVGVNKFEVGDRIMSTHHVPCNDCYDCDRLNETSCKTFQTKSNLDPGGFSQYVKISGQSVEKGTLKLPDSVSFDQGSFIEPLGTVIHGQEAIGRLKRKNSVLILGSGIAGILHTQLAKLYEVKNIIATDINENRLNAAEKFGADYVVRADEDIPNYIKKINNGRLADKVIVCTGAKSATEQALKSVGNGGTILWFAVPKPRDLIGFDLAYFWRKNAGFQLSYGATPQNNMDALELIEGERINVNDMITHRFSLDDIVKGFDIASKGLGLKVIIKPFD